MTIEVNNMEYYRLTSVPLKIYVRVLTPVPQKWGLHRGNQVKMRSLGWTLMQSAGILLKREKFGHRETSILGRPHVKSASCCLNPRHKQTLGERPSLVPLRDHTWPS